MSRGTPHHAPPWERAPGCRLSPALCQVASSASEELQGFRDAVASAPGPEAPRLEGPGGQPPPAPPAPRTTSSSSSGPVSDLVDARQALMDAIRSGTGAARLRKVCGGRGDGVLGCHRLPAGLWPEVAVGRGRTAALRPVPRQPEGAVHRCAAGVGPGQLRGRGATALPALVRFRRAPGRASGGRTAPLSCPAEREPRRGPRPGRAARTAPFFSF